MDQQRQDYIYIIADKVNALEAKFVERKAGILHKNKTSANNPNSSSSSSKDNVRGLEGNAKYPTKRSYPVSCG